MKSTTRKYVEFGALCLLAVAILWWFGRKLDWQEVRQAVSHANPYLLALAVLVKGEVSLDRIDLAFAGGESEVHSAYALAEDLVQDLLSRHGGGAEPVSAAILRRVGEGENFAAAFRSATGETLAEAEASYWKRRTFWNRWLPLVASGTGLWIGITLLALVTFQRRRARDVRLRRLWEDEERLAAELAAARAAETEREDEPVN